MIPERASTRGSLFFIARRLLGTGRAQCGILDLFSKQQLEQYLLAGTMLGFGEIFDGGVHGPGVVSKRFIERDGHLRELR